MLATPIGNLRDITLRALDVLAAVDVVAAEDTRITRHLLAHYGIEAKIVSLREHNEVRQSQALVALMLAGQSVALVSDAGTPAICDPGAEFVGQAREAGVKVWPVPGASALTCALSSLGWDIDNFSFHGFLPSQGGARKRVLTGLRLAPGALVFYEAPHRIEETLGDFVAVFGEARRCAVFRELSKKFEQFQQGTTAQVLEWLLADENHRRGEFVLVVAGAGVQEGAAAAPAIEVGRVLALLCEKLPTKEAVRIAAEITGRKRNELYDLALQHKPTLTNTPSSDD